MGRNKKKSKAAAHASSDSEGEEHEEQEQVPVTHAQTDATLAEGISAAREDAESSDSDDSDAPKKKKEYRGNRLKKDDQKGKKKKGKGSNEEEKAAEAAAAEREGEEEAEGDGCVKPVNVIYCPICSFPLGMCEFGGMMDKCRPWLLEHAPELADAENRGRKRRILTEQGRLEALLEGRGIKKALERIVVIDLEKRTGRRMITSVFGMDLFGHNLKDLSRDWRKRFSCGAGVRAAEEGKHQDCIDIQGNVVDLLAELLVSKYSIPKDAVYVMEGKKRKSYFF